MKKFFLFYFMLLPLLLQSQEACNNVYKAAMQEYNKGNYTEAQRKFLVVAQTCGNYSEVWAKLKDCNQKLAEQQKQQSQKITKLTNDNSTLAELKKKAEGERDAVKNELSQEKAAEAGRISGLNKTINDLNVDIQNRDVTIVQLRDSVSALQTQADEKKQTLINEVVPSEQYQKELVKETKVLKDSIDILKKELAQLQNSTEESPIMGNSSADSNYISESFSESKEEKVCNCNCWICKLEIKHQKNKKQKKEQEQQNNKENN